MVAFTLNLAAAFSCETFSGILDRVALRVMARWLNEILTAGEKTPGEGIFIVFAAHS